MISAHLLQGSWGQHLKDSLMLINRKWTSRLGEGPQMDPSQRTDSSIGSGDNKLTAGRKRHYGNMPQNKYQLEQWASPEEVAVPLGTSCIKPGSTLQMSLNPGLI